MAAAFAKVAAAAPPPPPPSAAATAPATQPRGAARLLAPLIKAFGAAALSSASSAASSAATPPSARGLSSAASSSLAASSSGSPQQPSSVPTTSDPADDEDASGCATSAATYELNSNDNDNDFSDGGFLAWLQGKPAPRAAGDSTAATAFFSTSGPTTDDLVIRFNDHSDFSDDGGFLAWLESKPAPSITTTTATATAAAVDDDAFLAAFPTKPTEDSTDATSTILPVSSTDNTIPPVSSCSANNSSTADLSPADGCSTANSVNDSTVNGPAVLESCADPAPAVAAAAADDDDDKYFLPPSEAEAFGALMACKAATAFMRHCTKVGSGGNGEVRRLMDLDLVIKRDEGPAPEREFAAELKSAARGGWVQAPLVDVVSVGTGNYYLYPLACGDLAAARPPPAAIKAVAAEMVVALAALHGAGLRHGDIKPANYLVARDGHLRLGDLGSITPAHVACTLEDACTLFYAPPEQRADDALSSPPLAPPSIMTRLFSFLQRQEASCASPARGETPPDSRSADIWALGLSFLKLALPHKQFLEAADAIRSRPQLAKQRRPRAAAAAANRVAAGLADLVFDGMLRHDATERLTIEEVKAHRFFEGVDWAAVGERRVPLPVDLCARLSG